MTTPRFRFCSSAIFEANWRVVEAFGGGDTLSPGPGSLLLLREQHTCGDSRVGSFASQVSALFLSYLQLSRSFP